MQAVQLHIVSRLLGMAVQVRLQLHKQELINVLHSSTNAATWRVLVSWLLAFAEARRCIVTQVNRLLFFSASRYRVTNKILYFYLARGVAVQGSY